MYKCVRGKYAACDTCIRKYDEKSYGICEQCLNIDCGVLIHNSKNCNKCFWKPAACYKGGSHGTKK